MVTRGCDSLICLVITCPAMHYNPCVFMKIIKNVYAVNKIYSSMTRSDAKSGNPQVWNKDSYKIMVLCVLRLYICLLIRANGINVWVTNIFR